MNIFLKFLLIFRMFQIIYAKLYKIYHGNYLSTGFIFVLKMLAKSDETSISEYLKKSYCFSQIMFYASTSISFILSSCVIPFKK